jgi:hypothetical protein
MFETTIRKTRIKTSLRKKKKKQEFQIKLKQRLQSSFLAVTPHPLCSVHKRERQRTKIYQSNPASGKKKKRRKKGERKKFNK